MSKVRWGILGVARIAVNRVIPALKQGENTEVVAIASRERSRAETAAAELGYEHDWGDSARWALALRYAATGLGRSYIDENYTTTQNADELSVSARVSLY